MTRKLARRRPPNQAVRPGKVAAAAIAVVAAGSLTYATAVSSAAGEPPLTVTATSSPTSGSTVPAGDTVTDTLRGHHGVAGVYSGQALVPGEAFGANPGASPPDPACTDPAGPSDDPDSETRSHHVPAEPRAATCTSTTIPTSSTITLQKTWVDAAAGDTAELSISGSYADTADSATSTARGGSGPQTDTVDTVTAPIFSGETVDLVEELGDGNRGSYAARIACDPGTGFDPEPDGQRGIYQVPAVPVAVTCTITNSRTTAALVLEKSWVNGAIGDAADLAIDGAASGSGFATAPVPASGNGRSLGKATTTLYSGDSVALAETLDAGNSAGYASQIACDQPGLTPDANGRGGTYQVPSVPVAVTCTITNTGTAPTLTLTRSVISNVQQADGTWTIRYAIAVGNPVTAPATRYVLGDTLAFGPGIVVNTAKLTGPPDETVNPNWDGSTDTTGVPDGALGTGETDDYTVTVNATVTPSATRADRRCSAGGGFRNQISVAAVTPRAGRAVVAAPAAASKQASVCAQPASPAISKRGTGAAPHVGGASWDITYVLSVANPSSTTGVVYDLTDTPAFPHGTTVNSATVIAAHDSSGNPMSGLVSTWDGTTLSIIAGRQLAATATDTFTVRVNAIATSRAESSLACVGDLPANGYFNTASATAGRDQLTASACLPIPPAAIAGGAGGPAGGSEGPSGGSVQPGATGPTHSAGPGSGASVGVGSTGVPIAELLAEALALAGLGGLLQLIFRRRRRPA